MEQQNVSENKNNSNDKQKQPDYIINTHIFCVNIKQGTDKDDIPAGITNLLTFDQPLCTMQLLDAVIGAVQSIFSSVFFI